MIDWMEKARRLQDFYAGRLSADEAEALRRDLGWPAPMPTGAAGAGMQDAWSRGLAANKAMLDAMTAAPGGMADPARMGAAAMEAWRQAAAATLRGFGGFGSTAQPAPETPPAAKAPPEPAAAAGGIEVQRQRLETLNRELQAAVAALRSLQEAPDTDPAALAATLKRLEELNAAATEAMQGYHAALAAEAAGQK